jgi:hypothetical protein
MLSFAKDFDILNQEMCFTICKLIVFLIVSLHRVQSIKLHGIIAVHKHRLIA